MAQISRKGYGQVEPNHLSAQKTGQIYAQLPAATVGQDGALTAIAQLEQGQFLKYDYANGAADLTGAGEWLLVYCEEKLYDERKRHHKDFVLKADDFTDGFIYPRLLRVEPGDIFTTNTFGANTSDTAEVNGIALVEKDYVVVGNDGFLAKGTAEGKAPLFQVAKVYTMPDGQPGVKLQRVK